MKTLPLLLLAGVCSTGFAGVDIGISADIRLGHAPPPRPPEVIVVEPAHRGPPPWAPGHWYRRNRAYYYYPGCDVYYRPSDGMWFYMEGANWRFGASLPAYVRIDFDRSVALTMETDRPYMHNAEVRRWYPADYFARAKFKRERMDRRDHGGPPDFDHGRGHDNGKGHGKSKKGKKGRD